MRFLEAIQRIEGRLSDLHLKHQGGETELSALEAFGVVSRYSEGGIDQVIDQLENEEIGIEQYCIGIEDWIKQFALDRYRRQVERNLKSLIDQANEKRGNSK